LDNSSGAERRRHSSGADRRHGEGHANTWQTRAPMPTPRSGTAVAVNEMYEP